VIGLLFHLMQLVAGNGQKGHQDVARPMSWKKSSEAEEAIHSQALLHRLRRHARVVTAVNIVLQCQ